MRIRAPGAGLLLTVPALLLLALGLAARTGATYASFDGGHFVMMVRRAEVRDAIAAWLRKTRAP